MRVPGGAQTIKFVKVFSLESFLPYGNTLTANNGCDSQYKYQDVILCAHDIDNH